MGRLMFPRFPAIFGNMTNGSRMPQNEMQMQATDCVAAEMARRKWSNQDLSDETKKSGKRPVDLGTIGDFLSYQRWPKLGTLGRFEMAFGWESGTLRLISLGRAPHPTQEEPTMPSPDVLREIAKAQEMKYRDVLEAALYEYGYLPESQLQWDKSGDDEFTMLEDVSEDVHVHKGNTGTEPS